MHDIVIRGGSILDGTGSDAFTGDIAIDGGKLTAVGGKAGPAKREYDANGLLVTPGWVDVHTHYDGQATWDAVLAPSSWHGVTTILFGNCGVGFAPVRKEHREGLIDLMEAIEDIPGTALAEGLKWDWESFPEYLDALDRMPRTIDIGAQIPHHPLRVFVMGERGINREAATAEDIAEMRRLTEESLRAGAFGFTTSRTYSHKTNDGQLVPGHFAEEQELYGIGQAMATVGGGAFGMNSDFVDEEAEFAWMTRLSKETGRPIWFLLTDRTKDPARWKRLMEGVHKARAQGANITAQVAGRPVGIIQGIAGSYNPFSIRPSYIPLEQLSPRERIERMRDPELRRQLLAEEPTERQLARLSQARQAMIGRWDKLFVMSGATPDYEPSPDKSIAAIAAKGNRSPQEVAYDYLTEKLDNFLFLPVVNYAQGDHEMVREMITDPGTLLGLSDGGAHCGAIVDASMPSFMLTHWGRDRKRGPGLPLPQLVKMQTSETADFFGFRDRGRLAPGLRADVNLIDFDNLRLHQPEVVHDLPAGGRRLVQRADGYRATLVGGTPVFENGEETGARPGRLVRAGR
ncbi:MAG TPA: amidohydrolase family protein [Stellaceae bacterium]|jgi:N-acyl-D-aspartate/D-glutamate deacylase|nr:amidohydrolase family protein [Stellaceae bacterium]